ncbi:MAG TPA: CoA transferase [Candidatus Binataceae bacterium]|jgi:crotonobetainyl-CoA:carnitine CoA-transferase CaiB-like acyl-CoA transferase|nr:CoA transferase [Candidatus Binataceae bacterium]
MKTPLDGIRVIDWTIWQQGPYSTALLGDLGAEVIKLETLEGDPGRAIFAVSGSTTERNGRNFYFESNNRHKKSVTLDLKKPQAREIVYRLVERSDVFVQNYRKGVAQRLGLDYKTLREHNPKLIYATASGYGPEGPDSGEPSFDYLAQARSGIMNIAGINSDEPVYLFGGVADQMGAIMLCYGVLTALLARERYGVGQEVNASHLGSMIALQGLNLSCRTILGTEFRRNTRENSFNPLWNHYRCADGKWLTLGMIQADRYWKDLCNTLGAPELIDDPRFKDIAVRGKHCKELIAIFDRIFATQPRDEWMRRLKAGGDFIYTVVNRVSDLPDDPQVQANEYVVNYQHPTMGEMKLVGFPVRFSETPAEPRGHAPELGEHTEMILTEMLGYSWEDVARLKESGVI